MSMNIRNRTKIAAHASAAILAFCLHAQLHAAVVSIISSSVAVQGMAGGNAYSGVDSGSTTGSTADGSTWRASSSGSITTNGASLSAVSNLQSGRGDDFLNAGYSQVLLTSVFQPLTPDVTFKFTGSTSYHAFESWMNYTLTDLTVSTLVLSASSKYEAWESPTQDIVPYTGNLRLNVNHQYQLQLLARSGIGDFRQGHANLNMQIIPEPAPAGLLAIALAGMISRRSRKAV